MFNNREIAVAIWAFILTVYVLQKISVRESLQAVWSAFIARKVLMMVVLMCAYVWFIVWLLAMADLWDVAHLKNTILWTIFVAFAALLDANRLADDQKFVWHAFADNFKLTAILEFIVNFHTFSLLGELVLVPIASFFVVMQAFTEHEPQYVIVQKFSNGVLVVMGLGLLLYAGYQIVSDYSSFAQPATAQDFLMPSALTLLFLPFLFTVVLYMLYERIAVRISFAIKDRGLSRYAFRQALRRFHVRAGLVQRWARNVGLSPPDSEASVNQSISDVYEIYFRERHPEPVPLDRGWSPFLAGKFLSTYELETGDYHRLLASEDEWVADSRHLEIGKGVLLPTITYHIQGKAQAATQLRLVLFGSDTVHENEARSRFTEIARSLYRSALNMDMPEVIEAQLLNARAGDHEIGKKSIRLKAERWQIRESEGYEQGFIIQNPNHRSVLS